MQYPLGEHERVQIASKTRKKLDEITLDAVMRNQIAPDAMTCCALPVLM